MRARSGGGSVSVARHLVPSRPVPPHLAPSRLVPWRPNPSRPVSLLLVSSRPTPSRLVPLPSVPPRSVSSHPVPSNPVPYRPISSLSIRPTPCYLIPSHPIPPQPIPSRPVGRTPPQRRGSPCCPGALRASALYCRGATGGSARRDQRSAPPRVHPHPAARWGRSGVSAALRFGALSASRCGLCSER